MSMREGCVLMPYYMHFREILSSPYRNFTATFDRNELLIYHKFLFVKFRYVYLLKSLNLQQQM